MEDTQAAVDLAVTTLARELGCARAEITVAEVRPVTWPDSALGCPKPEMFYLQVLTPGYQVRLAHNGQEHFVHTDRGHHAVHCPGGGIVDHAGAPPKG